MEKTKPPMPYPDEAATDRDREFFDLGWKARSRYVAHCAGSKLTPVASAARRKNMAVANKVRLERNRLKKEIEHANRSETV
jgi:hypothetical protein